MVTGSTPYFVRHSLRSFFIDALLWFDFPVNRAVPVPFSCEHGKCASTNDAYCPCSVEGGGCYFDSHIEAVAVGVRGDPFHLRTSEVFHCGVFHSGIRVGDDDLGSFARFPNFPGGGGKHNTGHGGTVFATAPCDDNGGNVVQEGFGGPNFGGKRKSWVSFVSFSTRKN